MTRNEAEEIVITVEAGLADRYGIEKSQYAMAILLLAEDEATEQIIGPDTGEATAGKGETTIER